MRKRIARLALLAVSIAIGFGILEVGMIVLEPWLSTGFYEYDHDLGFRVRPASNGTNRFGFNDRDYPLARTPGTYRILVLGDSFGWAGGQDGNYTARLERKFERHFGDRRVEVINAGYPMTHTGEQLALLEKYGLQYDPDLVVVGFFAGNDFLDAAPHRKRIVVNDTYFDIDRRRARVVFGRPIVPRSRLLHFLRQRLTAARHASLQVSESGLPQDIEVTFSKPAFLQVEWSRLEYCNRSRHRRGEFQSEEMYIFASFAKLHDLLKGRGTDLVVAIFPDEFQVDDALAQQIFRAAKLDPADYDLRLMQRVLGEYLSSRGIETIDLLDAFRDASRDAVLYRPRNSHWNDAGNELAASILFTRLQGRAEAVLAQMDRGGS